MILVNYWKNRKGINQELNIDLEGEHVTMDIEETASVLKRIKYISYVNFFDNDINPRDYSLLDIEIIEELLLILTSLHSRFSLVIKQSNEGKKKIVIHYRHGYYNYTEIVDGYKTCSSYLPIKESIKFAEKRFNNVIE